jgi:hypothetical protein
MRYLLLIYDNESVWTQMSEEEQGRIFAQHMAFGEEMGKNGNVLGGEALQPTATATTVRVRHGKLTATDGPFAETREQLGGFYLIQAKDLDEAIAIAGKVPEAKSGCIEVRPIMEIPAP